MDELMMAGFLVFYVVFSVCYVGYRLIRLFFMATIRYRRRE